ncbi:MAG TPA: class I SAM-dependent methyltransferase, partial [Verrucomicrobiae bacterium]|nr:class I SAM-dependent methyltransferase [Verrucomicrobiae bacterium]
REPRWAALAIIHRLDKETSGVMVFAKTPLANKSLTAQFTERGIEKKYLLLTDHPIKQRELVVKSKIVRMGDRYGSGALGELAETRFQVSKQQSPIANGQLIEAFPLTGRTHQIRVHAAESGFPVLGDTLYGGSPYARVCLHAAELTLQHPASGEEMTFKAPVDFTADARAELRSAVIEPKETNAFRVIHGAADGWPGWYVEKLGDFLLSQSEAPLTAKQKAELARLVDCFSARGAYHKILTRQVRRASATEASPQPVIGEAAAERFTIRENGVEFELSFNEGYSVGLFLDQRDNRRRLLTGHVSANFPLVDGKKAEVLNAFAYTCGFSVCAAKAGARTTSLDLSKKYLEWGKRNFALNGLEPSEHDFIFGDTFDWLKRLAKKQRAFDVVILDPPTFSQSKEQGAFRAEKDYGKLVTAALPVLKRGGILLASTNAAGLKPEVFVASVEEVVRSGGRKILQQHYVPQPPDFPITREEPGYLKTIWLRLG